MGNPLADWNWAGYVQGHVDVHVRVHFHFHLQLHLAGGFIQFPFVIQSGMQFSYENQVLRIYFCVCVRQDTLLYVSVCVCVCEGV